MKYILRCLSSIISMVLRLCLFMRKLRSKIIRAIKRKSITRKKTIRSELMDDKLTQVPAENNCHKED